jgi:hypothetical protein
MPGWDEASVDELLADPIVGDLMAADGVDARELRALLYGVQRTIERYAARQGAPTSLARFVRLCCSKQRARAARPNAETTQSSVGKRIGLDACSPSSIAPLGSTFGAQAQCTARS